MSIIWLILKLILYLLLGVVGLALLVVLLIVLLPIAYEGKLHYDEGVCVQAKMKIFYIIKLQLLYKEEDLQTKITLFGREIFKEDVEEETIHPSPANMPKTKVSGAVTTPNMVQIPKESVNLNRSVSEDTLQKTTEKKAFAPKTKTSKTKTTNMKKTKKSVWAAMKEAWEVVNTLWTDANRKAFFCAVGKLLKALWYAIKPHTLRFYLKVGRESPDETGRLIGWLACLIPFYAQYGYIVGDFEEEGISGEGEITGQFNIWCLVRPIIVLALNRSVRAYIHLILHIRKDEKHGIKTQQ
ncbi:MAG: hypothetical protein ACRCW2_05250 [Cellulosilyticaceae bacterium]